MSYIEAGSTVTVVSDSGVEAEALVVSSSAKKIRINMLCHGGVRVPCSTG